MTYTQTITLPEFTPCVISPAVFGAGSFTESTTIRPSPLTAFSSSANDASTASAPHNPPLPPPTASEPVNPYSTTYRNDLDRERAIGWSEAADAWRAYHAEQTAALRSQLAGVERENEAMKELCSAVIVYFDGRYQYADLVNAKNAYLSSLSGGGAA